MPGFDRSKYKAASLANIKSQEAKQALVRPQNGYNTDAHEVKDGDNWFRIMPFHPDETVPQEELSPFVAKCVSFLKVKQPKRDENKKVIEGEFEVKQKPIFNAKVHGGYPFDLVEEYMDFAKKVAIPNFVEEDKSKEKIIWNKIAGFDQVKKEGGLKPIDTWECYALDRSGKLATLSIKKTVKEQLSELAASVNKDPNSPDPFTDPEDGIAIIITKSGTGINTKYTVQLDKQKVDKFNFSLVPTPLTDDQLAAFDKQKSLRERFVNSYKHKDLEYQLEGLERFDKKLAEEGYPINVFAYDEFLNKVEEMFSLVPEDTAKESEAETNGEPEEQPKVATKPTVIKKPVQQVSQPVVKKGPGRPSKPVIQQVADEQAEDGHGEEQIEEEVKASIVPKVIGGKSVNIAKAEEPKHITDVNDKLAAIRAKLNKGK